MNFRFSQIALLIICLSAETLFGQVVTITGFSPNVGTTNDPVRIDGSGFTGVTNVSFYNNKSATGSVTADNQINVYVPAGATTGPITVKKNGASITSTNNFIVIGNEPYIASFSPNIAAVGTPIVINGVHFSYAQSVRFNGTNASFAATSDTQIQAYVPTGVTSGPISVTRSNVLTGTSSTYFYVAPTLTSFSPSSGHPGTNIVIKGTNFLDSTHVQFNGLDVSFVVNSNTQITATLPVNATTGPITIIGQAGQVSSSSNFVVLPTLLSFTPTNGPVGTTVTLTGIGFNAGTPVVKFNGTNAIVSSFSATQIVTTVPTNATSGPLSITTTNGSDTGSIFYLPPAVTNFSPASGSAGISVTIKGQNLTNTSSVKFNGIEATTLNVVNNNQLTATVPATQTGPITVTTPGGVVVTTNNFYLPPNISSFTPSGAVVSSTITINGANFLGVSAVRFNGTDATTFSTNDNSVVTANVPFGATSGTISIVTPGGTAVSAASLLIEPLTLSIGRLTNGALAVLWTTNATGFTLQNSTGILISNTPWVNDPSVPFILNGKNAVTNSPDGTKKFYRLKK